MKYACWLAKVVETMSSFVLIAIFARWLLIKDVLRDVISCFIAQKISPDAKDKIQLQVVLQQGGASTFHFANPDGRKKQIEERDSIKDLLQQLLPRFRLKITSEMEEKNRYFCNQAAFIFIMNSRFLLLLQHNANLL